MGYGFKSRGVYGDIGLLRVMLDTFSMVKAISAMEQRYQAVLAVIADGRGVGGVAASLGGKCIDTSMGFTPPRGA